MSDLLAKISSYNIFNYLLPGILFVVLASAWTTFPFTQDNLLIAAFIYYFIGMVISRIGSLFIEPVLRWTGFLKFAPYSDFVKASAKDTKIEVLSEQNNAYRTLSAVFVSLGIVRAYQRLGDFFPVLRDDVWYVLVIFLLLLFLFSHRKQTSYVARRVKAVLS